MYICVLVEIVLCYTFFFFFFNDTATTEIYTLSLHDALPISLRGRAGDARRRHECGAGRARRRLLLPGAPRRHRPRVRPAHGLLPPRSGHRRRAGPRRAGPADRRRRCHRAGDRPAPALHGGGRRGPDRSGGALAPDPPGLTGPADSPAAD